MRVVDGGTGAEGGSHREPGSRARWRAGLNNVTNPLCKNCFPGQASNDLPLGPPPRHHIWIEHLPLIFKPLTLIH